MFGTKILCPAGSRTNNVPREVRFSPVVLVVVAVALCPGRARAADAGPQQDRDAGVAADADAGAKTEGGDGGSPDDVDVDAGSLLEELLGPSQPPVPEPIPVPPPVEPPVGVDGGVVVVAPEPPPPPGAVFAATYRDQISPLEFRVSFAGKDPKSRAAETSAALAAALETPPVEGAPLASARMEAGVAVVRVQGRTVALLWPVDAEAAGAPTLPSYADAVETRLLDFVSSQLTRTTVQTLALRVFVSVFICVLLFLTLGALRRAFDRWDLSLVERSGELKPIAVFTVPVLGGEALRGLVAFGLAFGRAAAYAITVLVAAGAVLGQFDRTRLVLARIANGAATPVVDALDDVVSALPRVVLALVFVIALRAVLKVAHILLDGVGAGRVVWKPLPAARVPVARALISIGAVLVATPLIIALVFGRFGTPLELLALGLGFAVLAAAIPILASGIVGVFVLWQGSVRPGQWIDVDGASGEITSVSLLRIVLVPPDGGTVVVPMLMLALKPIRRLQGVPTLDVALRVARDRPTATILAIVRTVVATAEKDATVECVEAANGWLLLRVHATVARVGVRQEMLLAVLAAVDRGELSLHDDGVA